MIIAIARPVATVTLLATFSTVVLALDVSASMRATDVKPTRLGAAEAAARSFVNDQPQGTRIGVVSFAENAAVLQRPTSDKTEVLSALDHLEMQRGTALGKAVMASLKTIFPDEKLIDDPANTVKAGADIRPELALRSEKGAALGQPDNSSAIVLVSDGEDTADSHVTAALHLAAERGVRIFTSESEPWTEKSLHSKDGAAVCASMKKCFKAWRRLRAANISMRKARPI